MREFVSSSAPEPTGHWPLMARAWRQTGAPLRPSREDRDEYHRFAQEWIHRHGAPRILLFGVTPEIYQIPWPTGHTFTAVDRTPAMIDLVWPGPKEDVVFADWVSLPLPAKSVDLAFCDGGLHLLSYPAGQTKLVERIQDVIAPGGRCIFRLFVPPSNYESPDAVLDDLLSGKIDNLNILKLRLGMALQKSPESGIAVRVIRDKLRELSPNWDSLAASLGWDPDHLKAIDAYENSNACYHFTSLAQVIDLFCRDGKFVHQRDSIPRYSLGERCPMVVFERPEHTVEPRG